MTAIAVGGHHTVALVSTPTITTGSSGNNLTLLWPATMTGYRVESTLSFTPSVTWSNGTGTFQTNGGFINLVLPMTGAQKFYPLTKP